MLSPKLIHKTGRIDQVIRDHFENKPEGYQLRALELMDVFIKKGIFKKNYSRPGLPIRNLLRALDKEGKLPLIQHCRVLRNTVNRNWYFKK